MKTRLSKEREFYIAMTFLVAVIIFLFSGISTPIEKETCLSPATLYHLAVFFTFTFFLTLAVKYKKLNKKTIAIVFLISLIYAISDEFHQLFVIGRFASIKDILVDVIGSSLALLTLKSLEKYKRA